MKGMFDSSFALDMSGYPRMYKPKHPNLLTSDEKMTLYNLLMNNYHQEIFNKAIKYYNNPQKQTFTKVFTWNYAEAPEPHPTASGGKVRSEKKKPDNRKNKKKES